MIPRLPIVDPQKIILLFVKKLTVENWFNRKKPLKTNISPHRCTEILLIHKSRKIMAVVLFLTRYKIENMQYNYHWPPRVGRLCDMNVSSVYTCPRCYNIKMQMFRLCILLMQVICPFYFKKNHAFEF